LKAPITDERAVAAPGSTHPKREAGAFAVPSPREDNHGAVRTQAS